MRSAEGEISVDLTGKKSGRGAYICPSRDCLATVSYTHLDVYKRQDEIHSWSVVSPQSCAYAIDFLELTMPAPNPIPSSDQHGLLKECISAVGMIGVLLFVVYSVYCLTESSLFSSLKADGPVVRQEAPKTLAGDVYKRQVDISSFQRSYHKATGKSTSLFPPARSAQGAER